MPCPSSSPRGSTSHGRCAHGATNGIPDSFNRTGERATIAPRRRIRAADLVSFLVRHEMPIPEDLQDAAKKRLLIVDDETDQLKALSRSFKRIGVGRSGSRKCFVTADFASAR